MTPPPVPAALNAAADLLEEKGWCQEVSEDAQGRHCIGGALVAVAGKRSGGSPVVFHAALYVLAKRVPGYTPSGWNDVPGRTAEEVIALLRRVAAEETQP